MTQDNWKQRFGWCSFIALLLMTGAIAQARSDVKEELQLEPVPRQNRPYWLGIAVAPINEELKKELDLKATDGLVVERVAAGSPASKAGLARYDVVIKANDEKLKTVTDLMDVVMKSDGAPIKLTILRNNDEQTLEVKPVHRGDEVPPGEPPLSPTADLISPSDLPNHVWRMIRPGLPIDVKFPADLSVSIEKRGPDPGKITVKRGDQTWEVPDDKLSKLPDEVRGYVELYLGRIPSPPLPPEVEKSLTDWLPNSLPPGMSGYLFERLGRETRHLERRMSDEALPRVRELQDRLEQIERRLQDRLRDVEERLEERTAPASPATPPTDSNRL